MARKQPPLVLEESRDGPLLRKINRKGVLKQSINSFELDAIRNDDDVVALAAFLERGNKKTSEQRVRANLERIRNEAASVLQTEGWLVPESAAQNGLRRSGDDGRTLERLTEAHVSWSIIQEIDIFFDQLSKGSCQWELIERILGLSDLLFTWNAIRLGLIASADQAYNTRLNLQLGRTTRENDKIERDETIMRAVERHPELVREGHAQRLAGAVHRDVGAELNLSERTILNVLRKLVPGLSRKKNREA